ncbi:MULTISPECIES: helix-turn-helix domain-containing protein [Enterococcus]|uniref:helix-turn-helix domain-containing protein n=1 Tax=Enterococcus TaxID=1350 RepID=UPI00189B73A5|nr:helix-turn-helix domain-containing protein [Enterococcus faecalis]
MFIRHLYLAARSGDEQAFEKLIIKFHPLIVKMSTRQGYFDEDCYQECTIALLQAIHRFELRG